MLTEEKHCIGVGIFLMVFLCNCHPIEALKHVALNLSDLYTSYSSSLALYSNQIFNYLYKTVTEPWTNMYVISCIHIAL